jgi:OmpA-OmpF porin, OOP family
VVIVTGHTDRIGTREYNISLSNRRAEAVRNYLVQGGVAAAKISAKGVNSDEPVTTTEQCAGRRGDALKACYEPDRRVVVEVHGERVAE